MTGQRECKSLGEGIIPSELDRLLVQSPDRTSVPAGSTCRGSELIQCQANGMGISNFPPTREGKRSQHCSLAMVTALAREGRRCRQHLGRQSLRIVLLIVEHEPHPAVGFVESPLDDPHPDQRFGQPR